VLTQLYESVAAPADEFAESAYRRALDIRMRTLSTENPETAVTAQNVGDFLRRRGRLAEAEALIGRAFQILEPALGPSSPDLTPGLESLAEIRLAQGEPGKALPLLQRAVELRQRTSAPPTRMSRTLSRA
jgi:tetratricopeptide (TPR) repeat protein